MNINIHEYMEPSLYHVTLLNILTHNLNNCNLLQKVIVFNNWLILFQLNLDFSR